MIKNSLILVAFTIAAIAPLILPNYTTVMAFVLLMITLSLTWDIMGGQMGYNSFGNITFFGIGMYVTAVVQRELFSKVDDRFADVDSAQAVAYTSFEYFTSLGAGLILSMIICVIAAVVLGSQLLNMRGHYFAICTLGLGIAAGEIASGIDFIGAGSGMVTPLYPEVAEFSIHLGTLKLSFEREQFYYYLFFLLTIFTLMILNRLYNSRFGLVLNAIRDDEDKAEAMGIQTTRYKTIAWTTSAFILAIAGGATGNIIGFIDPIDVAFAGSTFGVWMILTAILGGKGTLWGPVIGAVIFYATKELFWTYLLGWQRVALGLLIVLIVVFFPTGILGWMRDNWPHLFGEKIDDTNTATEHRS